MQLTNKISDDHAIAIKNALEIQFNAEIDSQPNRIMEGLHFHFHPIADVDPAKQNAFVTALLEDAGWRVLAEGAAPKSQRLGFIIKR